MVFAPLDRDWIVESDALVPTYVDMEDLGQQFCFFHP
jgi:hypothetical protein